MVSSASGAFGSIPREIRKQFDSDAIINVKGSGESPSIVRPNLVVDGQLEIEQLLKNQGERMTKITLRVLDGANRGETYEDISLPITIGREEGNSIQLNDERVSRVHVRIQKDHDDLVLTDLDSTNGSRVNNEDVQLKILRHGDLITIGRSTLVYGSRAQIKDQLGSSGPKTGTQSPKQEDAYALNSAPPKLPERLSPGQAAQLLEVLDYIHHQVGEVVSDAELKPRQQAIEINANKWQQIVEVQARLAEYLERIGQPSQ